jgi:phage-related tail protein
MTPTKVWESTKTLREQCWLLVERIAGVLQAPPMKPQGKKVKVERRRNPQQERATQELREKIHKAHKPGKKITAIAREVICDRRTARRHLQDLGLYDEANE